MPKCTGFKKCSRVQCIIATTVQYSIETGFLCSRTAAAKVQHRYAEGDDQSGEEQNRDVAISTGHVAKMLQLSEVCRSADARGPSCCQIASRPLTKA